MCFSGNSKCVCLILSIIALLCFYCGLPKSEDSQKTIIIILLSRGIYRCRLTASSSSCGDSGVLLLSRISSYAEARPSRFSSPEIILIINNNSEILYVLSLTSTCCGSSPISLQVSKALSFPCNFIN